MQAHMVLLRRVPDGLLHEVPQTHGMTSEPLLLAFPSVTDLAARSESSARRLPKEGHTTLAGVRRRAAVHFLPRQKYQEPDKMSGSWIKRRARD